MNIVCCSLFYLLCAHVPTIEQVLSALVIKDDLHHRLSKTEDILLNYFAFILKSKTIILKHYSIIVIEYSSC